MTHKPEPIEEPEEIAEAQEEEPVELDIVEIGKVVEEKASEDRPFIPPPPPHGTVIEGSWNGYPNFGCSACTFASLDREAAEAHANRPQ